MENTIVAVYDNYEDASKARQALLDAGIPGSGVQLSAQSGSTTVDSSTTTSGAYEGSGVADSGSGVGHFFRSLFGMDDEKEHRDVYAESVRRGSTVLTVRADSEQQADRAIDIVNRFNPVDIDERSSYWRTQGWSGYDESAPMLSRDEIERERTAYGTARQSNMTEQTKIPVVQEELKVGKRVVQRGGVRIFQRVEETPVHETVNLREEEVKVERRPVDQPATAADMAAFKEGTIELTEKAEEAVVSKTARVVEEVVVGKEVRERTEAIDDTVRRTDVDVQQMGATGATAPGGTVDYDNDFRTHWQTSYGSQGGRYEDYDDAYRYGSTMASSDRYRNRQWADVETDVRGDWESSHPGSTWERVKDAVRYGAERVTGKSH